jgi:hypothetical protein
VNDQGLEWVLDPLKAVATGQVFSAYYLTFTQHHLFSKDIANNLLETTGWDVHIEQTLTILETDDGIVIIIAFISGRRAVVYIVNLINLWEIVTGLYVF